MSSEETFDLSEFSGFLPLFPLPNLVLFPGVIQPLHIFEARYREMLRFAQDTEHMIGMVLLQPGWEAVYEQTPAIYPVACMGRIMMEEMLADGRSNILLLGLCRVAILDEVKKEPFRIGQVTVLADQYVGVTPQGDDVWIERLMRLCRAASPELADEVQRIRTDKATTIPLGSLVDSIAATAEIGEHDKQLILEELDVARRARKLHALLAAHFRNEADLPPGFDDPYGAPSLN